MHSIFCGSIDIYGRTVQHETDLGGLRRGDGGSRTCVNLENLNLRRTTYIITLA